MPPSGNLNVSLTNFSGNTVFVINSYAAAIKTYPNGVGPKICDSNVKVDIFDF